MRTPNQAENDNFQICKKETELQATSRIVKCAVVIGAMNLLDHFKMQFILN